MPIEIRHARPEDIPGAIEVIGAAFFERLDVPRVAAYVTQRWEPERAWVAVDRGTVCGTFRSWPTEITVPGLAQLPAAAVTAVTVSPTHRRRGVLRAMTAAEHAAIRDRGEAMGLLYASEFGIYGRFGYGPATRIGTWTVDLTRTRVIAPAPADGTVDLVEPGERVRDEIRDSYDAWRRTRVSELRRRDFTWDSRFGMEDDPWGSTWKGFLAVHRNAAGNLDGFARYTATSGWERSLPAGRIEVQELMAMTEPAEAALWAFLGSIDLATTLKAEGRSIADRLPWRVANPRAVQLTDVVDALWVRLFDVPGALAARTYERPGSLVLDVVDEHAAGGRWRLALDGGPDGATCVPTDRLPDLTLPVEALGSIYLGAHLASDVALRLGVDEHRPGALAEADAMFRTLAEPWTSTFF